MSKRKVKLCLVVDYGGEYEDYWESPVTAFDSLADAERCAKKREHRQALWDSGLGYRDYSGSFVTGIYAVIDDSIFGHKDVSALELTGADGEKWECLGDIVPAQSADLDGWRDCQKDSPSESPFAREHVWADSDRPWYQVPGHSLSGLPLSTGITIEGTDYE